MLRVMVGLMLYNTIVTRVRIYHGSSTGAIPAFRGAIVTIHEIGGRF